MGYINPPDKASDNVRHHIMHSEILQQDIGYNIYLPPDYCEDGEGLPVNYHIHGWQGSESSEIWGLESAYRSRRAITVFINAVSAYNDYFPALWQIEEILLGEIIPFIEGKYNTVGNREGRFISGFSMGGAMAYYYAIRHMDMFCAVTAYAGTYHHLYNYGFKTVGVPQEKIQDMYREMLDEKKDQEENNILCVVRENAGQMREKLHITLRIGREDILFCDNEIMHLFLDSLNIPHEYITIPGAEHELLKIC